MSDVSTNLDSWSATESSNSPTGATLIGTGLDENLRMIQAVVRKYLATKGADITAAGTTDLSTATGNRVNITGSTTITAFGTLTAGMSKILKFTGAPLLTYNATSLILPGAANIQTAAGDYAFATSLGSGNWEVNFFQPASGFPVITRPVLATAQATTSGTSIDFTGIPSWAKRVTVMFVGVSLSSNFQLLLQIGNGSVISTGYLSQNMNISPVPSISATASASGFIALSGTGTDLIYGSVVLNIENSSANTWVSTGMLSENITVATFNTSISNGSISLAGALDRVRITTVAGTATFDAGAINISYE